MQEVPSDPLTGSIIDDRYRILSKVARGGMSTVYLAKDIRLNRNIALKILHPYLATDDAFIQRLQREAWSAASLSHPHVVQIHDHGVSTEHAYLVLEYIDGNTLREVVNENGPLTPRRALDLLDPVVEGLAAAHSAGLVHRDVKPENVLISNSGWVKIGDFGLSRAVTTTTNTSTLLGTVGYIAPELVKGEGGDARSDIYSVGIMLYELLTGSQPFLAQTPIAVAMAHMSQDVPAPSQKIPGLPSEMDELVRYLTEKDPDNRPSSGSALLEDLRHIRRTLTPAELDAGGESDTSASRRSGAVQARPHASAQGPAAVTTDLSAVTADLGSATQALPSAPSGAETSAIDYSAEFSARGAFDAETTVIAKPSNATSVLPPGSRLYVDEPRTGHPEDQQGFGLHQNFDGTEDLDLVPTSKRQARAEAKERAKAAARPLKTLGSKHPRRRAIIWILIGVAVALLGAIAGWYLGVGPGALATIPVTHNQSVEQAEASLHEAGFDSVSTTEVFDETVAAGKVVNTNPAQGESIRKFAGITLTVSKGPVLYAVPTVTGKKLDDAKTDITTAQLSVGAVSQAYSETVAAGLVISQNPVPGLEFRANTKIALVVSQGPKPIPVPVVANKTLQDAQAALKAVGLQGVAATQKVFSTSVPAGSVVSQTPADGTLTAGGKVMLTISKGPEMITVPDLVGKQVDQAVAALKALGFEVNVKNLLGGFFGTVRFQDPQGVQAPKGSTVTLQVI